MPAPNGRLIGLKRRLPVVKVARRNQGFLLGVWNSLDVDVLWLSQNKFFSELQAAKAAGRFEKKFSEFVKIRLLILDDFGFRSSLMDEDGITQTIRKMGV
jgi:DNA replication protein DnaC